MRFSAILRKETYMTSMGRTVLRREWEEAVTSRIHLTYLSNFSEVVPLRGVAQEYADRRGEDVVHTLKVSLEDVYNGSTKKLSLSRNILCPKCKGKGTTSGAPGTCYGCHGIGMRNITRQVGLGMIQHMQTVCPECRGSGEIISDRDKCTNFRASKVIQEKKVLEVHIEKGMQHGQKIVFQGQHKAINDEGMPHHGWPFMKGRLFVEFNVPESGVISCDQCRALEKILPPKPWHQLSDMDLDQCEETIMHDVNIEEEMKRKQYQRQQEAYDEDEEDAAPRVQCAQQ